MVIFIVSTPSSKAEVGNSLAFSTTTMLVSNNFLNANPGYTVAFWFYRNSGGSYPVIMGPNTSWFIQLYDAANTINFYFGSDHIATFVHTNGGWYHCAVVQTTNSLAIYRNGVQIYTSAPPAAPAAGTFLLGKYTSGGFYFNGRLDDLSWWARGLSSGEVYTVSGGGVAPYADLSLQPWNSGLVGHWTFNESSGTNATDSSQNQNTGRITGGAWTNGIVPLSSPPPPSGKKENNALLVLDALLSEDHR